MSEILTIDTTSGIINQEKIEPLPLYDENFYMLGQVMPEYKNVLPNPIMTKLVKRLKLTMKKFGGIGLSANQCGVQERMFVIGYNEEVFTCINPRVIEASNEIVKEKEGCLSFPGMHLSIARPKWIVAEFLNENGDTVQIRFEGITARCFLHELDHMNGVRFVDHVGPVSLQLAKQKQQKMIKKYQRQLKNKNATFF